MRSSDTDGTGGRSLEISLLVIKISVAVADAASDGEVAANLICGSSISCSFHSCGWNLADICRVCD